MKRMTDYNSVHKETIHIDSDQIELDPKDGLTLYTFTTSFEDDELIIITFKNHELGYIDCFNYDTPIFALQKELYTSVLENEYVLQVYKIGPIIITNEDY